MTEIINTLQDVTIIKLLDKYKTPIILEKLKKLFLIKDKRKAQYKTKYLNQMNFFLEIDLNSTT